MHKMAVFVEGQTESVFVARLLEEIAGRNQVFIEQRKATGGHRAVRIYKLSRRSKDLGQSHYVLIVDCGGDSSVVSDIRDQYEGLVEAGYQAIIGIRDVYPGFSHEQVPRLRRGLRYGLKTKPLAVVVALAIMEIESWFLAEYTHFQRIDPSLTPRRIEAETGFDPSQGHVDRRTHPARDLDHIYSIAGLRYTKRRQHVERTVDAMDYARVCLELVKDIPDLRNVVQEIERFVALPGQA